MGFLNSLMFKSFPCLTGNKVHLCIVLISGIIIHISLGTIYTFGNMLPYLSSYLRSSHVDSTATNKQMTWIFTCQSAIQPVGMVLGGLLEKAIGPRFTVLIGGTIFSMSVASSYCAIQHSYVLLLVTYGLGFGFGMGICYNTVLVCAMKWLPSRKGLANGIILAGFGCGAFVFNPVQTEFINPMNLQLDCDNNKYFCEQSLLSRVPYVFFVLAGCYISLIYLASTFLSNPPSSHGAITPLIEEDLMRHEDNAVDLPSPSRWAIFSNPVFYLLWFTFLLNGIAVFITSALYKSFGETFINNDRLLAIVGSVASIGNSLGRVFWGFVGDKLGYETTMAILTTMMCCLLGTYLTSREVGAHWMYIIWTVALFFTFCGNFALFPMAAANNFGSDNVGVNYPAVFSANVLSSIFGSLLSSALLQNSNYYRLYLLGTGASVCSFLLTTCGFPLVRYFARANNHRVEDSNKAESRPLLHEDSDNSDLSAADTNPSTRLGAVQIGRHPPWGEGGSTSV